MKIEYNNITNFKSLNNPIKPFKIKTKHGNILFNEIKFNQNISPKLLQEIGNFFLDNFAVQSSHPFWKKCRKGDIEYDKNIYQEYILIYVFYLV